MTKTVDELQEVKQDGEGETDEMEMSDRRSSNKVG
jgi:hypothetical protein